MRGRAEGQPPSQDPHKRSRLLKSRLSFRRKSRAIHDQTTSLSNLVSIANLGNRVASLKKIDYKVEILIRPLTSR